MAETVRVRFAPSPTGYLHVGGARTALFNWLYARQLGGTFVLRLEDTDEARNTDDARRTIFAGLRWLGLDPDEGPEQGGPFGPYSQSERQTIYAQAIAELQRGGGLYPCFCSKERLAALRAEQEAAKANLGYDRRCRALPEADARRRAAAEPAVWRLKVPEGRTVLDDLIRGPITVEHADVEDIILVRGDGTPVYNLAVVIDDHHMRITHVLRGEDHLTNAFKQIILFRALGWDLPRYGHLPLILGPAGEGKLSKRKHPEAALEHYITRGFHPDAVANWLALIGWSFDDHTEIMTRAELVARFSIERINRAGARLNLEKLESISGDTIRRMPEPAIAAEIRPHLERAGLLGRSTPAGDDARIAAVARMFRERLVAFGAVVEQARWVFDSAVAYDAGAAKNLRKGPGVPALLRAYAASLPDPLPAPSELEAQARTFAAAGGSGFGALVHPVRAAITGMSAGPPLFDCVAVLGRATCAVRLEAGARFAETTPA